MTINGIYCQQHLEWLLVSHFSTRSLSCIWIDSHGWKNKAISPSPPRTAWSWEAEGGGWVLSAALRVL